MDLQTSIYQTGIDPAVADDVLPLCELAKNFEEAGEFSQAAETLNPFWSGISNRPITKGLEKKSQAEFLVSKRTLNGRVGSRRQVSGAQENAKELISESAALFEKL